MGNVGVVAGRRCNGGRAGCGGGRGKVEVGDRGGECGGGRSKVEEGDGGGSSPDFMYYPGHRTT